MMADRAPSAQLPHRRRRSSIYLEEFAPKKNTLTDFIEVNINNLAAVPSIVFGLLGLGGVHQLLRACRARLPSSVASSSP